MRYNVISIILLVISVLLALILVFAVGIYFFDWQNTPTRNISRIIPYPIAIVDGSFVTYGEYFNREDAYLNLVARQANLENPETPPGLLDSLIADEIVKQMSRDYRVRVEAREVEDYYAYLLSQFGIDDSEAEKKTRDLFGLSERDFVEYMVKPDLMEAKLKIEILSRAEASIEYQTAKDAARELRAGMNFEAAAVEISQDEASKYIGGELGIFKKSELPPWFAEKVFAMKPGDMSNIVISPEGYHILLVSARAQSESGEVVQLKHIFIKSDQAEKAIEERKEQTRVLVLGVN